MSRKLHVLSGHLIGCRKKMENYAEISKINKVVPSVISNV